MKFLIILALILISCSERRVVYVDREDSDVVIVEKAPRVYYQGGYVTGRGYLSDDGEYYPNNYTYRYNGQIYRNGFPYTGSLLGAMAIGYYYGSGGPGYGRRDMYHTTVINKNTTIVKNGGSRYKKIAKQRKSLRKKIRRQRKQLAKQKRKLRKQKRKLRKQKKQLKKQKRKEKHSRKNSWSSSNNSKKKNGSWGRKSKRSTSKSRSRSRSRR